MQLPSAMKHDFSRAPQAVIPRSSFDRSFAYKTTFDSGYLIPFFVDEVLPGDTHNLQATIFCRFATLLFPLMDNVHLDCQFFFVPMRLLWQHWEQMNGYQANPGDTTDYILPTVESANTTDFGESSIYDYFGIATKVANVQINSLPLRAYNLIWNSWYRDENLQNSVIENFDDGPDSPSDYTLLRRGKRYDYFTSSLPTPQKGTAVSMPLGTTAPVVTTGTTPNLSLFGGSQNYNLQTGNAGSTYLLRTATDLGSANADVVWGSHTGLEVDLSSATAATINTFRQAVTIQRMYERDMRGGTRYQELVWSHFGVHAGDSRLQRPELLAAYSTPLNINSVPQTAPSEGVGSTPLGNLAAFATLLAHRQGFVKSFVEHGYVIGLLSARADLTYQQGTDRMWYNSTRFDFYWPEFSNLGEQAVLLQELYTQGNGGSGDTTVWGYQEAWAHYRYKNSKVTGLFRTNATGTLDSWHLSQSLSSPALNSSFIQENPPTTRVKATTTDPDFICDIFCKLISARPMPMYSVPGLTRL